MNMSEYERILMECRYLLSLNKSYHELSILLNIDEKVIYDDLNYKLKDFDSKLFHRVSKYINKNNL